MKEKVSILSSIYSAYMLIENDKDLSRAKLTLADYRAIPKIFESVQNCGEGHTFIGSVAKWFERYGCKIAMAADGVNYRITLE